MNTAFLAHPLLNALLFSAFVAATPLLVATLVFLSCRQVASFALTAASRSIFLNIDRSTRKSGRRAVTERAEGHVLPSNGR